MVDETNKIDDYYTVLKEVIKPTLKELEREVLGTGKYARFYFLKGNLMRGIPSKDLPGGSGVPAPVDQLAITIIDEHGTKELIALGLVGDYLIIKNIEALYAEYIPLSELTSKRIREAVCLQGSINLWKQKKHLNTGIIYMYW